MVLRDFGRHKTRTWYSSKRLTKKDLVCLLLIAVCVILAVTKRVVDDELFWYPF